MTKGVVWTLGRSGTPAGGAFGVEIGPRYLEGALLVCLHHGFRHFALLSENSLSDEVGDVVAPDGYKVYAGHRMLNR